MTPILFINLGLTEIILILFILIPLILVPIISLWKLFEKAEQPGWAAIVPLYNFIILMRVVNKPWWWALLCVIPYIGLIWMVWSHNLLVKKFGKTELFTVGLIFLPFIFFPILAFGNNEYNKG